MSGCIYRITCIPTGKSYIGQTTDVKYKNGKPYIWYIWKMVRPYMFI